jgi:hypothetical protein
MPRTTFELTAPFVEWFKGIRVVGIAEACIDGNDYYNRCWLLALVSCEGVI